MRKKTVLISAAVFVLSLSSYGQMVSLSISSGLFLPKEELYRDIYGQGIPLAVEVRFAIQRTFGLAAGFEYLSASGSALNVNQGDVDFPVHFTMASYPISVYFIYPVGKLAFWAAAGISFHSYKEEWEDLDLDHDGKKTKPFLSSGIEYKIAPRLSVRLSLRYQSIVAERGPYIRRDVDLGGLSVFGGLSLRIL